MIRLNRAGLAAVALCVLAAGSAHAQTLLEMEGIELRGSARVLQYGAKTCNVLEHVETPTEYERKKANHGQPVDVWQLDLSVYNGSGRPLDHLIAQYNIAAEYPPCTNWTGPEAGQIPGHVEWGGWLGTIQRSGSGNPTLPGETLTRTVYMLVFRGHEPRFDTWRLDYDFAATPTTPPAARTEPPPPPSTPRPANASAPTAAPAPVNPSETCAGKPEGTACFMEMSDQPGCYLWTGYFFANEIRTWSGECSGGYPQGDGTLRQRYDDDEHIWEDISEGTFVDGKMHGNWTIQYANGLGAQGPFVDGRMHGDWRFIEADGVGFAEGPMVDNKMHGNWTRQRADGHVEQGPYVDDKLHGNWTIRHADGREDQGPFVDGKRHGDWTFRYANGNVSKGPYVGGKRQGIWTVWEADGDVRRGPYVDGKRHGDWVGWFSVLTVEQGTYTYVDHGTYVDGEYHGPYVSCRFGEPANVAFLILYERGEKVDTYYDYDSIEDRQLAHAAAATCARVLPSLTKPSPSPTP